MIRYDEPIMEFLYFEAENVLTASPNGELLPEDIGGNNIGDWSEWFPTQE